MDGLIQIQQKIRSAIDTLEVCRLRIREAGQKSAEATTAFEIDFGICLVNLSEGVPAKYPASNHRDIAKGLCSQKRLAMLVAENEMKAAQSEQQNLIAQLTGYQTIYKHLDVA